MILYYSTCAGRNSGSLAIAQQALQYMLFVSSTWDWFLEFSEFPVQTSVVHLADNRILVSSLRIVWKGIKPLFKCSMLYIVSLKNVIYCLHVAVTGHWKIRIISASLNVMDCM
jgi:hypothetical protein